MLIDAVAERAADRAGLAQADAGERRPDGRGRGDAGAAQEARRARRRRVASCRRLQRRVDGKSETLFLDARRSPARSLADGLQRALDRALAQLPIPKVMQYQLADGWTSVSFVRPAHGLVALHGDEVVPVRALGLDAGRTTRGHRFEGSRAPIVLRDATSYETQLRDEGAVIAASPSGAPRSGASSQAAAARRSSRRSTTTRCSTRSPRWSSCRTCSTCRLRRGVPRRAAGMPRPDDEGEPEATSRCSTRDGRLTNRFLVVSNIAPADPARIVEGNERVVRPRLADAKFFYDQDRKRTLESRVPALDKVVYHGKLGSQGDRVRRVRRIAAWVAARIGADAALGGSRRAARQGRPADRHGRRVPRAAGDHGRLLRGPRRRVGRGRRRDSRPVRQPPRRGRCARRPTSSARRW